MTRRWFSRPRYVDGTLVSGPWHLVAWEEAGVCFAVCGSSSFMSPHHEAKTPSAMMTLEAGALPDERVCPKCRGTARRAR